MELAVPALKTLAIFSISPYNAVLLAVGEKQVLQKSIGGW
jgi:hypothetical protein